MNLTNFLESLPPVKLVRLYDHQWTVQAVFRSLPPIAKQWALRLLFVDTADAVPEGRDLSDLRNHPGRQVSQVASPLLFKAHFPQCCVQDIEMGAAGRGALRAASHATTPILPLGI